MLLQFEETSFWSYKNSCEKQIFKFSDITHLFKEKSKTTKGGKKSIIKDWIRKIKKWWVVSWELTSTVGIMLSFLSL